MYRLLFVEDEDIIRKVFPNIIDWASAGIEISGTARNGQEALKLLETDKVDIVLTDIRMPVMNGLELADRIKRRYPAIKTILLTAYSEFEYARKGIEYGVYGYLLKSIGEEEVTAYFRDLKDTLYRERPQELPEAGKAAVPGHQDDIPDRIMGHTKKIIDKVVKYLYDNYSRDISLDEAAAYVNVHPVHLSRLFRQELNQTFKYVLTAIRIEKARELLAASNLKVYEVSQAVGYKKPRYFSELFKGVTGLTPLEYREKR
jgi:two-component system sensor histidine kinase YesM